MRKIISCLFQILWETGDVFQNMQGVANYIFPVESIERIVSFTLYDGNLAGYLILARPRRGR
ncbi:MAG TPA: hypothetical protein VM101_15710 [Flavitalea sp.]|nr:hypothetical protein [Flavitalea sp.]